MLKTLRQIRYYSARREATVWSRATDAALFAAVLLAVPLALLADRMIEREVPLASRSGRLVMTEQGRVQAWLVDPGVAVGGWGEHRPYGEFEMTRLERRHGWPLVTSIEPRRLRFTINLFDEVDTREDVVLDTQTPVGAAVDEMLRRHALPNWPAGVDQTVGPPQRPALAWMAAAMIWWIALSVVGFAAVQAARGAWTLIWLRQAREEYHRLRSGRCTSCGYDMRGLEFNERCPECGELV